MKKISVVTVIAGRPRRASRFFFGGFAKNGFNPGIRNKTVFSLLCFLLVTAMITGCGGKTDYTEGNIDRIMKHNGFRQTGSAPLKIDKKLFSLPDNFLKKSCRIDYNREGESASVLVFNYNDEGSAISEKAIAITDYYRKADVNAKSATSGDTSVVIFTTSSNPELLRTLYDSFTKNMNSILYE